MRCWRCLNKVPDEIKEGYDCKNCGFNLVNNNFDLRINDDFSVWIDRLYSEYNKINKFLYTEAEQLESSNKTTPDYQIFAFKNFSNFLNNDSISDETLEKVSYTIFLIKFHEITYKRELMSKFGEKAKLDQNIEKVFSRLAGNQEITEKIQKDLKEGTQASYFNSKIEVRRLPNTIKNINYEFKTITGNLKNNSTFLIDHKKFKAHLSHELTHGYVTQKLVETGNFPHGDSENEVRKHLMIHKPVLGAVEEAACNVVTYQYYPNFFKFRETSDGKKFISFILDHYKSKGMPKTTLINSTRAFLKISNSIQGSKSQIVDEIRQKTVESIIELTEDNIDPSEAILNDFESQIDEKFKKLIRNIEIAEYKAFHSFMLLGIISKEEYESKKWTLNILESDIPVDNSKSNFGMISDKLIVNIEDAMNDIKELESKLDGEEKQVIEQFRVNLSRLKKFKSNEEFLKKPFCPNCGRIVVPEGEYCDNCGTNIDNISMMNLNKGIEFLNNQLERAHYGIYAEEKNTKHSIKEVISVFRSLVEIALSQNTKIMNVLSSLHSNDKKEAKIINRKLNSNVDEFNSIKKLKNSTEEGYRITKEAEENLSIAEEKLEEAFKLADSLESK